MSERASNAKPYFTVSTHAWVVLCQTETLPRRTKQTTKRKPKSSKPNLTVPYHTNRTQRNAQGSNSCFVLQLQQTKTATTSHTQPATKIKKHLIFSFSTGIPKNCPFHRLLSFFFPFCFRLFFMVNISNVQLSPNHQAVQVPLLRLFFLLASLRVPKSNAWTPRATFSHFFSFLQLVFRHFFTCAFFFSLVACWSSFSSSTRVDVLHELEGEVR
jgi:hypothetical protein